VCRRIGRDLADWNATVPLRGLATRTTL